MKLTKVSEAGIEILTGTGEIDAHDVQVLRAGLTQLLKSGKNRIILELPETPAIPASILYELSRLDLMARELSGRIVLAGSPPLQAQIRRFSDPPAIECFEQRSEAISYFRNRALAAPDLGAQAELYKADIRQKELDELGELRRRIATLENQNELLTNRLLDALESRRGFPPQDSTFQEQIRSLEQRLEELLDANKKSPKT